MRTAIEILVNLIKEYEGCRLKAYPDPASGGDPWTIGYGVTGEDIVEGLQWTQEEADKALVENANHVLHEALYQSPRLRSATPWQQAAVADFIYNLGIGAYRSSTLKRNIDAGDFEEAKHSILRWNKARIKGELVELPGLTRRRKAESDLL